MKELNDFRKFLNEDLNEGIMDKFKKELGDVVKAYKEFEKKMDNMRDKNPDSGGVFSALTGVQPTPRNAKVKEEQEGELHEGTWALGSVAEMVKVMGKLEQIRKMGAAKGGIELENIDTALYYVFGDDSFQDAIDAAKETDDDDRFNNFMSDAQARAKELYKDELRDAKEQGETGFEFKPRFGLEENDKVLDEVIEEATIFDRIDANLDIIANQVDAAKALEYIIAELQAISGGTKALDIALKRVIEDLGLTGSVREEKEDE